MEQLQQMAETFSLTNTLLPCCAPDVSDGLRRLLGRCWALSTQKRPLGAIPRQEVTHKPFVCCAQALMVLWRTIEDHDTLFVLAEISHFIGIGVLAYKLHRKKSVAGARRQSCTGAGVEREGSMRA